MTFTYAINSFFDQKKSFTKTVRKSASFKKNLCISVIALLGCLCAPHTLTHTAETEKIEITTLPESVQIAIKEKIENGTFKEVENYYPYRHLVRNFYKDLMTFVISSAIFLYCLFCLHKIRPDSNSDLASTILVIETILSFFFVYFSVEPLIFPTPRPPLLACALTDQGVLVIPTDPKKEPRFIPYTSIKNLTLCDQNGSFKIIPYSSDDFEPVLFEKACMGKSVADLKNHLWAKLVEVRSGKTSKKSRKSTGRKVTASISVPKNMPAKIKEVVDTYQGTFSRVEDAHYYAVCFSSHNTALILLAFFVFLFVEAVSEFGPLGYVYEGISAGLKGAWPEERLFWGSFIWECCFLITILALLTSIYLEKKAYDAYKKDFHLGGYLLTDKGLLVIHSTEKAKDGEKLHFFTRYEDIKSIEFLGPESALQRGIQFDSEADIYKYIKIVFLLNNATSFNLLLPSRDENFHKKHNVVGCYNFRNFYKKLYEKWQSYIAAL